MRPSTRQRHSLHNTSQMPPTVSPDMRKRPHSHRSRLTSLLVLVVLLWLPHARSQTTAAPSGTPRAVPVETKSSASNRPAPGGNVRRERVGTAHSARKPAVTGGGAPAVQPRTGASSSHQGDGLAPGVPAPHGPAASENHAFRTNQLLLGLVLILVGAKLGGEIFERMRQPAVLGELLVGILLGNLGMLGFHVLDFLKTAEGLAALAELGVILLLFEVGLESNLTEMRRVGLSSLLVATLGVVAPMALGFFTGRAFLPHHSPMVHVFIGATLCATSVGITARVLKDLGQLHRPEARIVLGAAVLDDVMGLVVLAVVSGLIQAAGGGGTLSPWEVATIVLKATGFLLGAVIAGGWLAPVMFRVAGFLSGTHLLLVTSLGFCFLLAWGAAQIGLAPIVGAFAAGLILDPIHYQGFQDGGSHTIEELIHPITGFLVPIFFVVTGAHVDVSALGNTSILGFAAALALVAVLGKQICALGVLERGLDRISVGVGMIPRGEVGLIFANIGLTLKLPGADGLLVPVVDAGTFSAIVLVVMVTTLITPPLLKWALARPAGTPREGTQSAAAG